MFLMRLRARAIIAHAIGVVGLLIPAVAQAASPQLSRLHPAGAQRGTEAEITLEGNRLADAKDLLWYEEGITVSELKSADDRKIVAKVKIAPNARLGEHPLRIRTASGISDLRTFYVGALPNVAEKEPNTDFATPQKIDLDVTVNGTLDTEDVDYYAVEVKKGQRLTAEVEGIRLGQGMIDPFIAVMDEKRVEIASCDDTALLNQDSFVSFVAPADGTYIIQVRDSSYAGDAKSSYRLHVGTFPRPKAVFPAGGQAGQEIKLNLLGDVLGDIPLTMKLPMTPDGKFPIYAEQNGQMAVSPNYIRVSPFAAVTEAEPNDLVAKATTVTLTAPFAIDGVIGTPNDYDYFKFTAKKGEALDFNVYARRLRSPLDPLINILDPTGKAGATNDDTNGSPDSYVRYTIPADGEYVIRVRDHLKRGGPDFVYRIEVTPVKPSVAITLPLVQQNSQERMAMAVPRGNRFGAVMRATRAGTGGEIALSPVDLPAGVKMLAGPVPNGADTFPVIFEAAADAPLGGKAVEILAKTNDPKTPVEGRFEQTVELIYGQNNNYYHSAKVDRLALAVTEEAPFSLKVIEPKVPLVQAGATNLKVVAERKEGFKGAIALKMLWAPPGISAGAAATIAADQNEAMLPISASAGAAVNTWNVAVQGSSDVKGPLWVCSDFAKLPVAPAYVNVKIAMSSAEQGETAQVACEIEQKVAFEGKAKIALRGLPMGATAPEIEFTSADSKVIFPVSTSIKTPATQHKTLFTQVTVMKDGEPQVMNVGMGGILRIDRKDVAPATQPAKPAVAQAGKDKEPKK